MTTLLVATTGGHLAQLKELADRLPGLGPSGKERFWVTFESPQSRSLLVREPHQFIPFIAERDVKGVGRGVAEARRLLKRLDIRRVVSTGSAIALAFLPYAALRGIETHYIESSARVAGPSLTGRLLALCPGVRLYRQYPHAARGRWRYGGSVFDAFETEAGTARSVRRVVVTLGSVEQSFRRLVERLAVLLPPEAEVFWQTGHTPTEGLGIEAHPFVPAAELDEAMRSADLVIAHGGCGSALGALNAGRVPILVPRDAARGELVDGHQIELARWLDGRGLALHRTPEGLTPADLETAAGRAVRRKSTLPPFALVEKA